MRGQNFSVPISQHLPRGPRPCGARIPASQHSLIMERSVHSIALDPVPGPIVRLSTVYYVRADRRYDIRRPTGGTGKPGTHELFRTIAGQGRLDFHDGTHAVTDGDSLVLTELEPLARYRCFADDWVFWYFRFSADGPLDLPLQKALPIVGALSDSVQGNLCLSLLQEDAAVASAHASAVLAQLLAKWSWQYNRDTVAKGPHREAVTRVVEMMHTQMGKRLTVEMMARAAGLSARRFRQVFEEATGLTPKKYFDRLRLETAAEMLTTTPLSIGELADRLGFSSQFHFSKVFKAYFNTPPKQYRG